MTSRKLLLLLVPGLASITKHEYTTIVVRETNAVLTVPPIAALIWRATRSAS